MSSFNKHKNGTDCQNWVLTATSLPNLFSPFFLKRLGERRSACYISELFPKLFLPFVELVRPENISFAQMWKQKNRSFAPPPAVQPGAGRLAECPASGHVLRGEKHLQLLASDGDCGCLPPMETSPKALGRSEKDTRKLL